jgi:hypothetical protein
MLVNDSIRRTLYNRLNGNVNSDGVIPVYSIVPRVYSPVFISLANITSSDDSTKDKKVYNGTVVIDVVDCSGTDDATTTKIEDIGNKVNALLLGVSPGYTNDGMFNIVVFNLQGSDIQFSSDESNIVLVNSLTYKIILEYGLY